MTGKIFKAYETLKEHLMCSKDTMADFLTLKMCIILLELAIFFNDTYTLYQIFE